MAERTVEQRLRQFLLAVAAFIFVGTVFELILLDHTEQMFQWIPFVVSGIGFGMIVTAWKAPKAFTFKLLRWIMVIVALSSLVGIYMHFSGNLAFTREINPSYTIWESLWPALKGSYPLLAPGILFLAGILGIAATYKHPLLQSN